MKKVLTTNQIAMYRVLRARGLTLRGAWRTMRRGDDAVTLAVKLRDALGQDGALAVLSGLLLAPFGAQRAAAVLRRWVPEDCGVYYPYRSVGWGIHAGAFGSLLRRALKAVPYVGDAPAAAPRDGKDALEAIKVAIGAMKEATDFSDPRLSWRSRTWRAQKGARHVHVQTLTLHYGTFHYGTVTLTVVEQRVAHSVSRWVARAEVGGIKFSARAFTAMGVETWLDSTPAEVWEC